MSVDILSWTAICMSGQDVCVLARGFVCADDELGRVMCPLWTDSFWQEITAICVALAEGSYSPPPARRTMPTQGNVSIVTRGIDSPFVLIIAA